MLKFFTSLRSRAIFLVLLAVLPLLAVTLYEYFDQRAQAITEVQRDALVAARNLAIMQETLINNTRQLLATLTQLPAVQRQDRDACDSLFAEVLQQCPYYAILGAANLEGWIFSSAPQDEERSNVRHRPWFKKAVQTQAFSLGEILLGRISQKYSMILSFPIFDEQGSPKGVIYAGIDLNWLGNVVAKSDFPSNSTMILTDPTWKVLYRYPEPLKYVGSPLPDELVQAMAKRDEGVAAGGTLPRDKHIFAFVRLSAPWQEMRVSVGLPRDWALARVNRDLRFNLIGLAAVALLALTAAHFGAKLFILQPVSQLLEVTQRLTGGDLSARTGAPGNAGELAQLATAFDQMADSLQEREADLKQTTLELEQRVLDLDRRSLELAAANKELENFTYSVAHDLRAPLRAIGGFARVLLDEYPGKLDVNGERYLNIINQEAFKMGRLIDDLLALARLGRKEMRYAPIVMTDLVRAIFTELKAAHPDRDLQVEIQPLPQAFADLPMIRLVLANLLQNAIKFTQTRETALIQVSGWSEGRDHVYCVRDNGVGFDMRYANKLFGVFQRLHPETEFEGTGTGLAIAKRIIERHGGRIWGESVVNEGAAFYFTLPKKVGA